MKNGREAWRLLVNQYAGEDKWQSELKRQDELLHNRQWKEQSNFLLEKFIAQHRNAFVSIRQCAEHVTFQLPSLTCLMPFNAMILDFKLRWLKYKRTQT
jgi:hypothetical protein